MLLKKKFKKCKEDFICEFCNTIVQGNGYTNHCFNCLYSKHVDINPGDRASKCKGMMKPIFRGLDRKGDYIIHYCEICRMLKKNKINSQDNVLLIENLPFE